jgi:hypothetical protein
LESRVSLFPSTTSLVSFPIPWTETRSLRAMASPSPTTRASPSSLPPSPSSPPRRNASPHLPSLHPPTVSPAGTASPSSTPATSEDKHKSTHPSSDQPEVLTLDSASSSEEDDDKMDADYDGKEDGKGTKRKGKGMSSVPSVNLRGQIRRFPRRRNQSRRPSRCWDALFCLRGIVENLTSLPSPAYQV